MARDRATSKLNPRLPPNLASPAEDRAALDAGGSALQQTLGNQEFQRQLLTEDVPPALVRSIQPAVGNHAVQRLLTNSSQHPTGVPSSMVASVVARTDSQPEPVVQRDIEPGGNLPDFAQILGNRVDAAIPEPTAADPDQELADAKANAVADDFLLTVKGTYRQKEKDSALGLIRQALEAKRNVRSAEQQATEEAKVEDAKDLDERSEAKRVDHKFYGDRFQYVTQFFAATTTASLKAAQDPARQARANLKNRLGNRAIAETTIKPADKKAFAQALKEMPFITLILSNKQRDPNPTEQVKRAGWKGDRTLQDDIREETDGLPPEKQFRKDLDNGAFRARVVEADRFVRLLVEPELLAAIAPPSIHAHTKHEGVGFSPYSWFESNRFRAYQNGTEVHVAQNDETAIIVHEVGHYLEKSLPPEVWSDISKLIMARDIQANPSKQPSEKAVGSRGLKKEGGFAGDYPATGPYTSRAYSSGDTEMMSLTIEFLKRPSDTLTMIEKDPVQTAVVLRGLRPKEYAAVGGLRPFDKFLPQNAG